MTDNNKRVLLAGATGYLGRYLLKELKKQGYWVRVLIRSEIQRHHVPLADEVFIGEITDPGTLRGIAESIDVVISTIGITRQKDGLTYMDVDYQGNMNLLHEARSTSVNYFQYISAINGDKRRHLKIFQAKESFVDQLKTSGIDYTIMRPNGFFSDMHDFLEMAGSGRVYLFGKGDKKLNPIDGKDLASVCVSKIGGREKECIVGGPDILSQREIAVLALKALDKKIKIVHLPDFLRKAIIILLRTLTSSQIYGPYEFFLTAMAKDNIAPQYGMYHLEDFFQEQSH
ncbi:SDR family oxidoreductase [Sphingobacterium tabacisoli]|uniref:SDR family oxidoreductase n=1 Tax=Sphingobacterium tabacisoli TaxID=2044855 RepID=A0ABW5L727_9SPHI|nr:SDR family oxidoreductase [Sphingobacterium tabacisoli]